MVWCRWETSHCMCHCWPRSVLPNGVIRPPCVHQMTPKHSKAKQSTVIVLNPWGGMGCLLYVHLGFTAVVTYAIYNTGQHYIETVCIFRWRGHRNNRGSRRNWWVKRLTQSVVFTPSLRKNDATTFSPRSVSRSLRRYYFIMFNLNIWFVVTAHGHTVKTGVKSIIF